MQHGDIELVVSRFFCGVLVGGAIRKRDSSGSSRVTTDQPRASLKANWQTDFVDQTQIRNFRENSSSPYQLNLLQYPFSLKAVSNTCIARSAAMVRDSHFYRMTRFYVSHLSTRPCILGEFQSKMIVFRQQYGNENSLAFISVDFGLST